MKNNYRFHIQNTYLIYLLTLFLQYCSAYTIYSPVGNKIILANNDTKCELKEFKHWYFLWGMIPIGEQLDSKSIFSESDKTYRITKKYTPSDIWINVPVAFITSFIRITTQIETCPNESIVVAKEKYNQEKEPKIFLGEKKKIIITLKDNKTYTYEKLNLIIREGEYFYESLEDEKSKSPQSIRGEDIKQIVIKESK